MASVTLEEARAHLEDLIGKLGPGEEVIIVRDAVPVGKLVGVCGGKPTPVPGRGKGKLIIVAEDDEHLKDFAEYMP